MVLKTSYSIDNDLAFEALLAKYAKVTDDLSAEFAEISEDFYVSEQAIFQLKSRGRYDDFKNGGKDSPYAKAKLKKYGFIYPLLKATGDLERSVTSPRQPGSLNIIDPKFLIIGTTVPYGVYHQGDKPGKGIIPQRKFLFIGPESTRGTSETDGRLQRWVGIVKVGVSRRLKRVK